MRENQAATAKWKKHWLHRGRGMQIRNASHLFQPIKHTQIPRYGENHCNYNQSTVPSMRNIQHVTFGGTESSTTMGSTRTFTLAANGAIRICNAFIISIALLDSCWLPGYKLQALGILTVTQICTNTVYFFCIVRCDTEHPNRGMQTLINGANLTRNSKYSWTKKKQKKNRRRKESRGFDIVMNRIKWALCGCGNRCYSDLK